jgi:uncharacterized protein with PQ loop repeat
MNKNKQLGFTAFEILVAALVLVSIYGYIANIVKLVWIAGGEITTMFVLRIVGIFAAPLGVILGFF